MVNNPVVSDLPAVGSAMGNLFPNMSDVSERYGEPMASASSYSQRTKLLTAVQELDDDSSTSGSSVESTVEVSSTKGKHQLLSSHMFRV